MRSYGKIHEIVDTIHSGALAAINNVANVKASAIESYAGTTVDDALNLAAGVAKDIEAVVKAQNCDGLFLPKFLSRVLSVGDSADKVVISVRTKLNSSYKYRKDTTVAIDADFVKNVGDAYLTALFEMFYIDIANENIADLNTVIDGIIAENEIPYSVKFAVDHTTDADVLSITDDVVVFNASIDKAMRVSDIGIMRGEDDDYSALITKAATDKFIAVLKTAQTTVQFMKSDNDVLKALTGLPTRKKASKLIRKSYHRQAKFLAGIKSGIGYYDETVIVDGEETDVFALVSKDEDGAMSVVLSPFDVKTLYNVDYDVLSAIQ